MFYTNDIWDSDMNKKNEKVSDMTLTEVFEYIHGAAGLRLLLEPWLTDQTFLRQGKSIFYAVDTDVVKLFTDPINNIDYATIFSNDGKQLREIKAWALGRFIFFRLTKNLPLFVIPPNHIEMEGVFAGIARDALKEYVTISDSWTRLEKHVENFNRTNDMDILVSTLEKEPLDLIRWVYGGKEGYNAELSRVSELFQNDRLLHIERYMEKYGERPWTFPLLQENVDSRDYDILKELTEAWSKKLIERKSKKRKKHRVLNDAEVLARLEWINRELPAEERRLVLISGDPSLQKAANDYNWDQKHTFADLFIRDPRVFLASPDFFSAENMDEDKVSKELKKGLIEWLDVFLDRYDPLRPYYDKRLKEVLDLGEQEGNQLAHDFLEKIPDGISKLKSDWKYFVQSAGAEYGLGSDPTRESLKKFAKMITTTDLQQVRQEVDRHVREVWANFWEVAALIARDWNVGPYKEEMPNGVLDTERIPPTRGIPPLEITIEPIKDYIKTLCSTLCYEDVLNHKLSSADFNEADPSGYTVFLFHALAFAAAGRWNLARTFSEFALHTSDNYEVVNRDIPENLEPITGNEAAYLLAWTIRLTSKSVEQLGNVRRYLQEAEKRKEKATGSDIPDHRYVSEFIALDMTYHLFNIFLSKDIPSDIPTIQNCQERILALLAKLERDINVQDYIRITVEKQLLSFLFCTEILRQFKNKETVMNEEALRWLSQFKASLENIGYNTMNCFTHPICLVACCLYGEKQRKKEYCFSAKDILSKIINQKRYLLPYDEKFYGFLLELVKDQQI